MKIRVICCRDCQDVPEPLWVLENDEEQRFIALDDELVVSDASDHRSLLAIMLFLRDPSIVAQMQASGSADEAIQKNRERVWAAGTIADDGRIRWTSVGLDVTTPRSRRNALRRRLRTIQREMFT
ncbi:MAG: hypothetical protein HYZ09_03465 [Candidatus Kerfeldbacteria bacterium]|nr:hypothetical protein [Candidatus Kerfeldbacteria bacterium]